MPDAHDNAGFDALVHVIESLQERIRRDGDTIGSNEIRTRTALVDPLLNALGWDTTDPAMVIPEYAASGGVADYALLKVTPDENTPVIAFIEAKRLNEPLESHRAQMLNYANMTGVKYAGLTNGDRWELYEVFKEAPLHERRIVDVSLLREPVIDCAVQLLPLKWPSPETGESFSSRALQQLLFTALAGKASPSTVAMLLHKGASLGRGEQSRQMFQEVFHDNISFALGWNLQYPMLGGWTPLHVAALNSTHPTIVSLLLDHGADANAKSDSGWTPLHGATRPAIARLLIEHGADVRATNVSGRTVLHHAININSNSDMVELLLEHGADVETTDDLDQTLLDVAVSKSNPAVVALLLDHGADTKAKDKFENTVLHSAIRWASKYNPSIEVVALLLNRGADVGAKADFDGTPLHLAAALCPNPEVLALFLDRGADIEAMDKLGETPLHKAAQWNPQLAVVELLLDRGADPTATDHSGRTPCRLAEEQGTSEDILRLLRVWNS